MTLSAIGDSVFYYFPLIIGWTSAKKFGLKPVMGMALGGILVYPTLVGLMGGDPLYTLGAGTVFESNVYGDIFGIHADHAELLLDDSACDLYRLDCLQGTQGPF